MAISLRTPIAHEENALSIDSLHDAFALWNGFGAAVAVIPLSSFEYLHFAHDYTCGFHWPELVMTYQSGSHCVAFDFSVQL